MPFARFAGWPDIFGGKAAGVADYNGVASYVPVTGDTVPIAAIIGAGRRIHWLGGGITEDGLYEVKFQSGGRGPSLNWFARWYYAGIVDGVTSVIIATAGSGQTNGTYTITDTGTNFTGVAAQVQIVIAGGAITKVTIVTPGSGYFGAPTFTVAEGGTPGTLTGSIGSITGGEVAAGVNLSASYVKAFAIGE